MTATSRRHSSYLLPALSVASLSVSAAAFPPETSFRFVMLLVILLIVRRYAKLTLALDLALGSAMLAATWAAAAKWYSIGFGVDKIAHTVVPAVATMSACYYLENREPRSSRTTEFPRRLATFVSAASFVILAAVAWEIYEWIVVNVFRGTTIHIDDLDTAGDLVATVVGCVLGGLLSTKLVGSSGLVDARTSGPSDQP